MSKVKYIWKTIGKEKQTDTIQIIYRNKELLKFALAKTDNYRKISLNTAFQLHLLINGLVSPSTYTWELYLDIWGRSYSAENTGSG